MTAITEQLKRFHVPISTALFLAIGSSAAFWFGNSDYYSRIIAAAGLYIIVVLGLNVLSGLGGQLSLGHAGFYALGAYTVAILTVKAGVPVIPSIVIATVLAGLAGLLLAIPALRVSGPYLAMVTLAFGIIIHLIAVNFPAFTGGAAGVFPVPAITFFGEKLNLEMMNYLIAVLGAITVYMVGSLIRSRWGRALRAISGNATAAASSGVPVVRTKRFAFVFSALLAGLAGGVYATVNEFINPDPFHFDLSILFLTMLIVGGSGLIWGPIAGVVLMVLLERALSGVAEVRLGVYAIVLILILRFLPTGIVGTALTAARRLITRLRRTSEGRPSSADENESGPESAEFDVAAATIDLRQGNGTKSGSIILEVQNLTRRFGELAAVNNVSLTVEQGSLHALVGPNGAGKSTLFNLISGVDNPDEGSVQIDGVNTTGTMPHRIAELGVARTFQNLALFDELTVVENVLIGSHLNSKQTFLDSLVRTPRTFREEVEFIKFAHEILEFVDLDSYSDELAGDLPQGLRRKLELARALASKPKLLLLDEPAAGLNPTEVDNLGLLLRKILDQGTTIILVEHHMKLVMSISDVVTVLDSGKVIAEGPPEQVQGDEAVVAAYLGTREAAERS